MFTHAKCSALSIILAAAVVFGQQPKNPAAAALKNPVAATPESIAAGKKAYDANCAGCHGNRAQGAVKAGIAHLDHPGAGREAAARSDRRQRGPRLDRRRDLHRHQEGRSADDDGRVGGPNLRHRDLEHRQLPSSARGEPECRTVAPTGLRQTGHATADTGAGGLRPDADHRRHQRRAHTRPAGARELPARGTGRPPLLRERPQRAALHPRQADEAVHDLSRFQRSRRPARPVPEAHLRAQLRDRPHQLHLRPRLRAQRRLLHDPHGGSDHRGARRAEARRRARPRPVGLPDDAGDRDADRARRADHSRRRDDRVDRPQHRERDVRRHGARAAADAAGVADPPAR